MTIPFFPLKTRQIGWSYSTDVNPNVNHDAIRQDTYGCGISHPICIARIQHGPKGWVLIQCGQRAAKHPLHATVPGKTNG